MILNWVERIAMNNPLRYWFQRSYETRWFLEHGGPLPGGNVLEIGCGRGAGTQCILDAFAPNHVDAFDLDPQMVALAGRRHAGISDRVRVWQGDATCIEADDGAYDAVFNYGIIHHVPDWEKAVAEVYRVLRPGGRFYCEEILKGFIGNPLMRLMLDHPRKNRFDADQFINGLKEAGFAVNEKKEVLSSIGWFIAEKKNGGDASG